jgi:HEAT repeat protein
MQVHPIRSISPGRQTAAFSALVLVLIGSGTPAFAAKEASGPGDLTQTLPASTKNSYNLGPTGALGWMYVEAGMTEKSRQILVTSVEKGSPAEGKLETGDVILGVFGQPFSEDARKCFGRAIGRAESEAARGMLPLTVWRKGTTQNIELKLQVMGSYSDTSPYNCPKAQKILDQGLAIMVRNFSKENSLHINELALLASGRPEHLELVRKSAREVANKTPEVEALWQASSKGGMATWHHGYNNLFLCEYYRATGDKSVLPAIRAYATTIARGQGVFGTWGHGYVPPGPNGQLHGPVPPYGPVNATGLPCFVSLVLADMCGIDAPELKPAIARSNMFFGYYAGKGYVPYGEHPPGIGHDDNGKTSMTAMAFALQGKGPESRFFTKMVTASYESREWGHTGNGFSYLWGPVAANAGGPLAMAAFMKELRWYYDLARRWDGAFVNVGTGGGVSSSYHGTLGTTGCYMLAYATPLKKIALTGRDAHPENWLTAPEVVEAVAAERWLGEQAHAKRTTAQLLAGLAGWSPLDRAWSARELGLRKDDVLPQLIELTRSNNPNARLGAVAAIGQLKGRAIPALDTLAKLLNDDDRWLRVQTAEALRTIGADAKPVLPQMLKAVAVKDDTDQMQFATGALSFALFYPGGAQGSSGILAKSFNGVSKDLLYPAIRSVTTNPDSAARGCARSIYQLLTLEDAQALAPEIVASIKDMAPANTMFSKGVRLAGIQALARLHLEEGIPLALMLMKLPDWGKAYIIQISLDVLKEYRGAAKSALPELKQLEVDFHKMQKEHDKLLEVIATIENDQTPPKLVSLKACLNSKSLRP